MGSVNERIAHAAMDEQAERAATHNVAMRRIMPKRPAELQRYVIEGPYKREERNPRLGLLILLVSATSVGLGIWWALS